MQQLNSPAVPAKVPPQHARKATPGDRNLFSHVCRAAKGLNHITHQASAAMQYFSSAALSSDQQALVADGVSQEW